MADQTLPDLVRAKYPGAYDDISDADLDAKVRAKFPGVYDDIPKAKNATSETVAPRSAQSDSGAVGMAAAAKAISPTVAELLADFGTSPTAAATAGKIANAGTTLAGVVHGAMTMSPAEVLAASKAGWAAGKGGYFLARGAQSLARPVSTALEAAAPYAKAAALSGAQGGLDLAQMDDPKRQDIGVLGVGTRGTAADQAAVMGAQIKSLMTQGMSRNEAAKTVYNAWAKQLQGQR